MLAGSEAPAAVAVWREIASALGIGARIDQGRVPAGLHATRSATLQAGKDPIGAVGEVDPAVLRRVRRRPSGSPMLELDLDEVLGREPEAAGVHRPSVGMPSSDLDLAFVVPDDVPAEKLAKAMRQGAGELLVDIELFDMFRVGRQSATDGAAWPIGCGSRRPIAT